MASPLAVDNVFQLSVDGKTAYFKVVTVNGDNFTAELQADVSGAFGADLRAGNGTTPPFKASFNSADQTITLSGKALYQRLEMDFGATYNVSGTLVKNQQAPVTPKDQPSLTIGVNSLFGDTGSLIKDVNVSGAYNAGTSVYDWSGNLQLDFTPEDTTNKDEINVSLSNLGFGQDTNNANKGYLSSATLTLSQGGGNALSLGGVSIAPQSLTISYADNRATPTNNQYTKAFSIGLIGEATWGSETTSKDDDFILGLDGSGTYTQIYATASIQGNTNTSGASFTNPVKINGGLTAFAAKATGKGSIDLGPLTLLPKEASISYAADLDKKYALWNLGGSLGLQVGFLPDVTLSLGQNTTTAKTGLDTILSVQDSNTYPTAGGWSLGTAAAALTGTESKPLVDLGLLSVDGVNLSLTKTGNATGPDLSGLGFYKFVDNNVTQPKVVPTTLKQDTGKAITLDVQGVKLNSSTLVNALKGTTDTISEVLSPVRPLVDFFTQQVTIFDGVDQALKDPIVSFLESTPNNKYADDQVQAVEFVDAALAAKSMLAGQTYSSITPAVKAAENVFTVLDAVSNLAEQSTANGSINLGNFSFSYPLNKLKPQPATAPTAAQSATTTTAPAAAPTAPSLNDFKPGGKIAQQIASTPNPTQPQSLFTSNSSVSFPVLSDPIGYISKYFTEGSADLFNVNLDFGFAQKFDVSVPVPAFPVVKVGIQGGVDASLKTSIASSLDAAALTRLKDGFSVTKLGEEILKGTGIDLSQTQAQFGANLGLSVGVDAYIASLKLVGGLEGRLTIQPVLMKNSTEKAENQVLKLGDSTAISKPAYVQAGAKLKQLRLEIEQNLDNVIAIGLDKKQAYSKNTWLITIVFDSPSDLNSAVAVKLGSYVLDRLRLIEIDDKVMQASTTDYKKVTIDLAGLRDENKAIYAAGLSALKEQLKSDLPSERYNSLTDADFKELMRAIRNTSPRSIEYATIDASTKASNSLYEQRKEFLQKNLAFELIDGTAAQASTRASKQTVTYYPIANQTASTSNFYQPSSAVLNSGTKATEPELVVKINGKLNQSFNSVAFDLLPTNASAATSITIKAQDSTGTWKEIGVLSRGAATSAVPASLSLASALDDKAAELLLIKPKDTDSNKANYKLVLNLSNENKDKSNTLTQSIIEKASNGTLQLAFDFTTGSTQAIAISDARIVQGGAVSIGVETSITNSKLLTNAVSPGQTVSTFGIFAQPTDILNPAENLYARNAFGGVPTASVSLGAGFPSINKFDSLAIVNAINRTSIADTLSNDVKVKASTTTRQTVDPVTGDTYLSYIDQSSGNIAVAKKDANSSVFQSIKIFTSQETAQFRSSSDAPDLVAYNGRVMGAATAVVAGKLARYLITSNGDLKKPIYTLQIDSNASLTATPAAPIRLGLIAERDVNSSSSSNQLTVAFAYSLGSSNGSVIQSNKNLKSTNYDSTAQVLDLNLETNFSNWDGISYTHGGSVVDVDFMEFGTESDLRSHLALTKGSTQFSLEGTKDAVKIWNTSAANNRRYQYDLNIPGITPSSLSVVYTKQPGSKDNVPVFIDNWKGTAATTDRTTGWKSDTGVEKNLSIAVTGTVAGNAQNNYFTDNNQAYSGLTYNQIAGSDSNIATDVVYHFSPYNDMLTANAAALRLASYTTANNSTASQNVNMATGGLAWYWYPILGKSGKTSSNIDTSNINSSGYLRYAANSLVTLDQGQDGSVVSGLKNVAKDNFVQISKNTFQILPRSDGNYALSGMAFPATGNSSAQPMIVSVDQIPNYETGLLTTKAVYNTPLDPGKLVKSYFDGSYSFVNQGEWAPLGISSTPEYLFVGDLRDPAKYSTNGGLLGQYYNDKNSAYNSMIGQTPSLTRIDNAINFSWGANSPGSGVNADQFSVRWTGYIKAPTTGVYTFSTAMDDGAWLSINGSTLVDKWERSGGPDYSGTITLEAGKFYSVDLRYYEYTGNATANFYWQPAGQSKEIVPASALYSAIPSQFVEAPNSLNLGISKFNRSASTEYILRPGQQITSPNGKYSLDMQQNGELILYKNTLKGRVVIWNINDFRYESDLSPLVGGHTDINNNATRAVAGTSLVIKQQAKSKSGGAYAGYYLSLEVPKDDGKVYIPLNPDYSSQDNIAYRRIQRASDGTPKDSSGNIIVSGESKDYGWESIGYSWRNDRSAWKVTNTNEGNDQFGYLQLTDDGNLVAYDDDSSNPNRLFSLLSDWDTSGDSVALTDATPYGFNGLVSDLMDLKSGYYANTLSSLWDSLAAGNQLSEAELGNYQLIEVSPDLNSTSPYVFGQDPSNSTKSGTAVRDVVLNGSGGFSALLAKRDGVFTQLSDAITWGPSAPPANQLKSIRFLTPINEQSDVSIDQFIQNVWSNVARKANASAEFDLLNGAVPIAENSTWEQWLNSFKAKYSSLRALSVLPAVSSRSYFSVPTIELTPRTADLGEIYKTYAAALSNDQPHISIDINFKLDAFVKVVASFAWWSSELLKATFPIVDETWSFKTGYGAGGPVYGTQQIHLDQDHDLIADKGEIASVNADAAFNLDLTPLAESLRLAPESPRNTIWNGSAYVYAPPSEGIDFRSGLLVVQPNVRDSVFDAATGLANNKVYISVPDSEYLVANIWTSLKYSSVLDYQFFSQDATEVAKSDFYAQSKLRYSSDPYFVTKLTPVALEALLNRRLAAIPAAYSTSAGDTFDAYNGVVAEDRAVADQAFEAFRFTSRLTFVLETVERLLNRLKLDTTNWGQADAYADRRSLISSYQLIPYLAMAAEGLLDPYYSQALKLAASGQSAIVSAIDLGNFKLDLSNKEHVQLLLNFAVLTVPNSLGQSQSPFGSNGRLDLTTPNLPSWLSALKLDAVAGSLSELTAAYSSTAQSLYQADPRLLTAALAPIKRDALRSDGLIDAILQSSLPASVSSGFGTLLQGLLQGASAQRPAVQDSTRIASITEAVEYDVDANGKPIEQQALRISLNHAAPPGGTIVSLTYGGQAKYGVDYQFAGNAVQPKYVYIPFDQTSVVVPIVVLPQQVTKDWTLTVGIEDPSSSYNVSADINKVFLRYRSSVNKLSLYDNNVLVRLSDDPQEPHKLLSASPEDRNFDYNFYRDSRVVGVEAEGAAAQTLQYFVNSENPLISIYSIGEPSAFPPKSGSWILVDDAVMQVYAGDAGPVDVVQYFNPETGVYGYAPANEVDHAYQGSAWQNQGVVFSLRQFNREIAEAIGTITPVATVGTSFQAYPERTGLLTGAIDQIKALGIPENQINANGLRLKPQLAAHQKGRSSMVLDLASVADRVWDPAQGLAGRFVSSFSVQADGSVRDFSFNPSSGAGARFYSLHSSSGSLDTVVFDVADGVDDADGQVNNQVDATTATAFAATFNPRLQANNGALQLLDANQEKTPLVGGVKIALKSRGQVVQDLRYTVLAAGETVADLLKLTPAALEARSRLLISSLENTDVTLLPSEKAAAGSAFSQAIPLTNGQQLVLLERSGRAASGAYQLVPLPSGLAAATTQTLTTPGGLGLTLEASTSVNRLPEFLGRDQQQAPVLNFTGLDGQAVGFEVELAREADYNSTLGFYRVIDSQGSVRDTVSGAVITPGDPGYAKAALAAANRPNLRTFAVADNATDTFKGLSVQEAALLAPYGQLGDGTTLFAFAAANPDGRSHFKVLGQNIFGFEDQLSSKSDFDYDDNVLAVRTPTLIG